MKWCRCDGNPNCFDCGGKGYLNESDGPKRVSERLFPSPGSVECPKCKVRLRPSNLTKHLRRTHNEHQVSPRLPHQTIKTERVSQAAVSPASSNSSVPVPAKPSNIARYPLVNCKDCSTLVRTDRLRRHAKRCKPPRVAHSFSGGVKSNVVSPTAVSARSTIPMHRARNGSPLTICSQCGALVKNLGRHANRCVPPPPTTGVSSQKPKLQQSREGKDLSSSDRLPQPYDKSENRMDKTRDYGRFFRDQGRFGSPVSHDDFDDDSSP